MTTNIQILNGVGSLGYVKGIAAGINPSPNALDLIEHIYGLRYPLSKHPSLWEARKLRGETIQLPGGFTITCWSQPGGSRLIDFVVELQIPMQSLAGIVNSWKTKHNVRVQMIPKLSGTLCSITEGFELDGFWFTNSIASTKSVTLPIRSRAVLKYMNELMPMMGWKAKRAEDRQVRFQHTGPHPDLILRMPEPLRPLQPPIASYITLAVEDPEVAAASITEWCLSQNHNLLIEKSKGHGEAVQLNIPAWFYMPIQLAAR